MAPGVMHLPYSVSTRIRFIVSSRDLGWVCRPTDMPDFASLLSAALPWM
jgi:hypothetical protein